MKYYQIQYNNNDFFAQMQRMRDDAQKLWDQMDHDVTKLSPELQQELAHLRQLILEMKPSMDEEEACMNRCMLIGTQQDRLSPCFVLDRIIDVMNE